MHLWNQFFRNHVVPLRSLKLLKSLIQAKYEDCGPGGSGRLYESLKHRVVVSYKNPLKVQDLRMRTVGYCGVEEIDNTLNVIEDLERFAAEDRLRNSPKW